MNSQWPGRFNSFKELWVKKNGNPFLAGKSC